MSRRNYKSITTCLSSETHNEMEESSSLVRHPCSSCNPPQGTDIDRESAVRGSDLEQKSVFRDFCKHKKQLKKLS